MCCNALATYPAPAGASDIPGLEVAGTIVAAMLEPCTPAGLAMGDRVCALVAGGGYAELCVAPVGQCLPVPAGWSDVEAASLPETVFHGVEQCVRPGASASLAKPCWCRAVPVALA